MGKLVLVPTPIGNLEDITLRALRILKEADLVLAEDTRKTGLLMQRLGIEARLQSFHAHNEHQMLGSVLRRMAELPLVVLVSDAGTPGISDPGFLLVRAALAEGIEVECLPGATAFVPALVASGLPCDRFVFEGFLPHKKGRQTRLLAMASETRTQVLYESPHRLVKCLEQMVEHLGGDRLAAVGRELSKLHEEVRRGTLLELAAHYKNHPPKGECVVVVGGPTRRSEDDADALPETGED